MTRRSFMEIYPGRISSVRIVWRHTPLSPSPPPTAPSVLVRTIPINYRLADHADRTYHILHEPRTRNIVYTTEHQVSDCGDDDGLGFVYRVPIGNVLRRLLPLFPCASVSPQQRRRREGREGRRWWPSTPTDATYRSRMASMTSIIRSVTVSSNPCYQPNLEPVGTYTR